MLVIRDKDTGVRITQVMTPTLEGVDFSRTRLRYAALKGHNLQRAKLQRTNFWGADLREGSRSRRSVRRSLALTSSVWWDPRT